MISDKDAFTDYFMLCDASIISHFLLASVASWVFKVIFNDQTIFFKDFFDGELTWTFPFNVGEICN